MLYPYNIVPNDNQEDINCTAAALNRETAASCSKNSKKSGENEKMSGGGSEEQSFQEDVAALWYTAGVAAM